MREVSPNRMEDFSMDFPGINATMTCLVLPPRSNSHGVFDNVKEQKNFLTYSTPLLELQMGLILIISHLTRFLLKPFGISDFVSGCLTGIILGPCGLGKFGFMREIIFPHSSQEILSNAAMLGYSIDIFLAGVKMEVGMVFKIGRKAILIGMITDIIPRICLNIVRTMEEHKAFPPITTEDVCLYAIVVTTSLPAVAYVIDQLNLTNTDIGRLGLASGLVSDVFGVVSYTLRAVWNSWGQKTAADIMRELLPLLSFVLVLTCILRPLMKLIIRATPDKRPLSTSFVYAVMAFAIVSQAYFVMINEPDRYLAVFLFGLVVPCGAPLGSALVEKFGSFNFGVLVHVMVPTAFMRADFALIFADFGRLKRCLVIIVSTILIKMVSTVAAAMITKVPIKKGLAIAFILNYIGIVHLTIGILVRDLKILREDVYANAALYMLINATVFPIIIKKLCHSSRNFQDCKGRNILNLKPRSELKILTCIYAQENVESYIKILNALHPTRDNPISVYALHLNELIGRYLPVMISHSKNKMIDAPTSQGVLYTLYQYEQNNWDSVSVHLFTSFSSFPLMHQDITDIAFEKKTSLIILPLHRRWSVHGHIESDDKRWRSVNRDVLDKAPCSVAIFFSRGRFGNTRLGNPNASDMSVCMIFFGGDDDRESLLIAKQMLREPKVTLTIFHFLTKDLEEREDRSEDRIYDNVLLDDIRHLASTSERLNYNAYEVQDGPQTAQILHSMANQFDLFIVGRRFGVPTPQTAGLTEWNELPELGTIGDLLASKDLETRASVLVVQQESKLVRGF